MLLCWFSSSRSARSLGTHMRCMWTQRGAFIKNWGWRERRYSRIQVMCKKLGFIWAINERGNNKDVHLCLSFLCLARPSPHVKSGVFMGQMKSIWRAMTSPVFDFQGDLHQQGGAIIVGPGKRSPRLTSFSVSLSVSLCYNFILFSLTQAHKFIFLILTQTVWTTCPLTGSCSLLEFNRLWTSAISRRLSMCSELATRVWVLHPNLLHLPRRLFLPAFIYLFVNNFARKKFKMDFDEIFIEGVSSVILKLIIFCWPKVKK